MLHTLTGLAQKPADAQRIIDDLVTMCVCDRSDISIIGQDALGQSGLATGAARAAGQVAAVAGGAAATTLAGMVGLASAAFSKPLSGFGLLSAAGRLGTTLSRTALATASDLAKAFSDFGIEADLAREYAQALKAGKILVVVDAKTDNMARCVQKVLAAHGAVAHEAGAH